MKPEFKMLIAKQEAGYKLSMEEIRSLMSYALELLREFDAETQASIRRLRLRLGY
jgi:hypothetical protein